MTTKRMTYREENQSPIINKRSHSSELEFGGEGFEKGPLTGIRRRRKVFDNGRVARGLGSAGPFCLFFVFGGAIGFSHSRPRPAMALAMAGDSAETKKTALRAKRRSYA